ncbi:ninjurin-2-like [Amphibalanus amphitrite]|uniref:ninjurin-2-like n=1 Tax=Amphibalanus amphitrite TaxID=1232801 RepID=UPI001C90C782|nr:ninjurin-2-like [Amphibalanus amphitrite]
MAETFVPRARGPAMDPSEVETFDPATGPGRSEFEPVPEKPRTKWREVADPRTVHSLDPDVYSTKKSVAQGFMDVALLSANADQLRTLLKTGNSSSPFYTVCLVFISLSLITQVTIAVLLLVKVRYNINKPDQFRKSETLNNVCMIASVFLTVFNVLVSSFMSEVPGVAMGEPAPTPEFGSEAEILPGFNRDPVGEPVVGQ